MEQTSVKAIIGTVTKYLRDHGIKVKYTVIYGEGKRTLALVLTNVKAEAVLEVERE